MDSNTKNVRHRKVVYNGSIGEIKISENFYALSLCNEEAHLEVLKNLEPGQVMNMHELYVLHYHELPAPKEGFLHWIIPIENSDDFIHLRRGNTNTQFKSFRHHKAKLAQFWNNQPKFYIPLKTPYKGVKKAED